MNISRLFDKSAVPAVTIGSKPVTIPKLTIAKWQELFGVIESLPRLALTVLATKHSDQFVPAIVAAAGLAIDESVRIVAVLTELEPDYIRNEATPNEIIEFIRLTAERNDLEQTLKNVKAVLGRFRAPVKDGNSEG